MSLSRPAVALAGVALAGIAVAGVGAGATFQASTTSSQKVTAGTLDVSVWSPSVSGCTSASNHCHALSLADVGPVSSTFETTPTVVYVTNTGNIPATYDSFQLSATDGNNSVSDNLLGEMNVCLRSTDPGYAFGDEPGTHTWVEGNGPLTAAIALKPTVKENGVVLQPGQSATYAVDFYAGKNSVCGQEYSDGPNTIAAWTNKLGGPYQTPASLGNEAMGGVVTPTLSFNFTG